MTITDKERIGEPQYGDVRLPQHFWSKVCINSVTGCWEWTAGTRRRGYGRFGSKANQRASHRVAYEALVAPIPEGLQLDHLCRVPGCVNPAHLEPVTGPENTKRGAEARAAAGEKLRRAKKTHCKNGHEYTPENTYFSPRAERRVCRTCQRLFWMRNHSAAQASEGCGSK